MSCRKPGCSERGILSSGDLCCPALKEEGVDSEQETQVGRLFGGPGASGGPAAGGLSWDLTRRVSDLPSNPFSPDLLRFDGSLP